jgi:hypothetical protein
MAAFAKFGGLREIMPSRDRIDRRGARRAPCRCRLALFARSRPVPGAQGIIPSNCGIIMGLLPAHAAAGPDRCAGIERFAEHNASGPPGEDCAAKLRGASRLAGAIDPKAGWALARHGTTSNRYGKRPMGKSATRSASAAKYSQFRQLARDHAAARLAGQMPAPLALRPIAPDALDEFDRTWAIHPLRIVQWPWRDMAADYRRNWTDRFELAIWSGDRLCGLCLGKAANNRHHIALRFLEASPDPSHPLKGAVALAAFEAANAYGIVLGADYLYLMDPLPGTLARYLAMGFDLVRPAKGSAYCRRGIQQ